MLSPFSRSLKSDRFQMLGVLDQQCCVRLHGALVYMSSLKDFKNLFGLKTLFLRLLMQLGPVKLPAEST